MKQSWVGVVNDPQPTAAILSHTFTGPLDITTGNQGTLGLPFVVPANAFLPGQMWRLTAGGTYSTSGTTPTLSFGIYVGTAKQHESSAITLANTAAVEWLWQLEYIAKIVTVGKTTTGTMLGSGRLWIATSLTVLAAAVPIPIVTQAAGATGFDTSIANTLSVQATYSASASTNRINLHNFIVELLN